MNPSQFNPVLKSVVVGFALSVAPWFAHAAPSASRATAHDDAARIRYEHQVKPGVMTVVKEAERVNIAYHQLVAAQATGDYRVIDLAQRNYDLAQASFLGAQRHVRDELIAMRDPQSQLSSTK